MDELPQHKLYKLKLRYREKIGHFRDYYELMSNNSPRLEALFSFCQAWYELNEEDPISLEDMNTLVRSNSDDCPSHILDCLNNWKDDLNEINQQLQKLTRIAPYPAPEVKNNTGLLNPQTVLEKAVSKLDKKLLPHRELIKEWHSGFSGFAPASPEHLNEISSKYTLPDVYIEFLTRFSPIRVGVETDFFYQGLGLFGAHELLSSQNGYSFAEYKEVLIDDWNPAMLVIGSHAGDPLAFDLSKTKKGEAPLFYASHDEGPWKWEKYQNSFIGLLECLSREISQT